MALSALSNAPPGAYTDTGTGSYGSLGNYQNFAGTGYNRDDVKAALYDKYTGRTHSDTLAGSVEATKKIRERESSSGNQLDLSDTFDESLQKIMEMVLAAQNGYATSALKSQADEAALVRAFNAEEAAKSRAFNAFEAQKARDWQAQREDTAYQRLITDLRLAGVNPLLAFGSGNASPSVGSAVSASGPSASGVQANYASAKNADKLDLDDLIPVFLIPLLSSALKTIDHIATNGLTVKM